MVLSEVASLGLFVRVKPFLYHAVAAYKMTLAASPLEPSNPQDAGSHSFDFSEP